MTEAGAFEYGFSDLEAHPLEGQQTDPGHDQVAPQELRSGRHLPEQAANHRQMLRLDEGDLAHAVQARAVVVSVQSTAGDGRYLRERPHRRPPLRPHADPLHPSGSREARQENLDPRQCRHSAPSLIELVPLPISPLPGRRRSP